MLTESEGDATLETEVATVSEMLTESEGDATLETEVDTVSEMLTESEGDATLETEVDTVSEMLTTSAGLTTSSSLTATPAIIQDWLDDSVQSIDVVDGLEMIFVLPAPV